MDIFPKPGILDRIREMKCESMLEAYMLGRDDAITVFKAELEKAKARAERKRGSPDGPTASNGPAGAIG